MKNNNYTIKSKALADIQTISDYIAQDNKTAALELIDIFNKSFEKLAKFPDLGVIKKRYLVVYNIEDEKVCILRVLTSYQNICSKL